MGIYYTIGITSNDGHRTYRGRYLKKALARKELRKLLSPPKSRIVHGKKMYLTSYRNAQTGFGINNPRIRKHYAKW